MKKVAGTTSREPVVAIPLIVEPVRVQVALRTVPIEVQHVAVTVRIEPASRREPPMPPPIEYSPGCIVFGIAMP